MATFDSTNIEIIANTGTTINYGSMPLSPAVPDIQQLQVRWSMPTVYQNGIEGVGIPVTLANESQALQDAARILDATMYSVDADKHIITFDNGLTPIANSTFQFGGSTYYRPNSFALTVAAPGVVRRSTDINSAIVDFQPGARLTSELLNASNTQLLNATQEITAFTQAGGGGSGSNDTPNLGASSIWELADTTQGATGLLNWDGSQVTSGASGSLVPPSTPADEGFVLAATDVNNGLTWYDLPTALADINQEIYDLSTGTVLTNALNISALEWKTQNINGQGDLPQTNPTNGTVFVNDIVTDSDISADGTITSGGIGSFNGVDILAANSGATMRTSETGGFYVGSINIPTGGQALYSQPGGSGLRYTVKDSGSAAQRTVFQATEDGGLYTYCNSTTDSQGRTLYSGKLPFLSSKLGYTYTQSSYEDPGLAGDQKTFVLINPQGAQRARDGQGGSTWLMQGRVKGDDVFRFGNEGQAYFVDDTSYIMMRPNYLGNPSQMTIAQYDASGSHPSGVNYNWFVKGTGVMTCYGFHNYCDETLKDFTNSQTVTDATAALRDIDIKSYTYKSDSSTTTYGFSAQDLLDKGLDTYGIVQEVPAQAEETDVSELPDDVDNPASTETVITQGNADSGTPVYEVDNLGLSALTIQSVQEVDARMTNVEAAVTAIDDYLTGDLADYLADVESRLQGLGGGTGVVPQPPVINLPGLGGG